MNDVRAQKLEEVNYRQVNKDGPSCIYCPSSDDDLSRSEEGVIISHCYFFNMEVDELHICDLFGLN